ncbi:MAG: hypothetical protein RIQ93_683 [Verrucomicrobiota bacterium]|jgi:hypothetical protein
MGPGVMAQHQHHMTAANVRDALLLLDSAIAILNRPRRTPTQLSRELRVLSIQFDLLRLRLGESDSVLLRN